jgi:hypothetical protein
LKKLRNLLAKKKLILIVTIFMVFSFASGVFASSTVQAITAYLAGDFKFTLNGESWQPRDVNGSEMSPIVYQNRTYLPVRAIGEALGVNIGWIDATRTVVIGDSIDTSTIYSRTNPAPIGVAQRVTVDNYSNSYTAEVAVKETIRGEAAWEKIKEANMFNEEAGPDEEYILAKIYIKAIQVKDDKSIDVSSVNFDLYNEGNTKYNDFYSVVTPEPSISTSLYSGAEHEGYVAFKVKKADENPKIAYGLNYDGTGGIWFKL